MKGELPGLVRQMNELKTLSETLPDIERHRLTAGAGSKTRFGCSGFACCHTAAVLPKFQVIRPRLLSGYD